MTITEATHALARARRPTTHMPVASGPLRLSDAMRRVEATWVEAVAVVQAVCTQLPAGRAIPALETITIGNDGAVTFSDTPPADDAAAVAGAGHLLTSILGRGECPMQIWEAAEQARFSPARVGTPQSLMARLTCLPVAEGSRELARYYQAAQRPAASSGTMWARLSGFETTTRTAMLLVVVLLGGVGTGVSVGAYVAARAVAPAPAPLLLLTLSR